MARNNLVSNVRQSMQKDSVSWGSLALWIGGLIVLVSIIVSFSN
ncbi:hypothetical protein [Dulcicalothrix desertica]|nr:hypothetical protein [Dulcicalothrix desertica]TWH40692.1 hypothetical protein CAL7102_10041 [Dulcicalothrix desertica PCC 7102]